MKVTRETIRQARRELLRRAAKQDLSAFVRYTFPKYQMGWVHREICQRLDKFLQDVRDGLSPRLIICMPPRSGKSELVSRRFPAYVLGREPEYEIVECSYSSELSVDFCRKVQEIMTSPEYAEVFPDTNIPEKGKPSEGATRTSDHFDVVGHNGKLTAVGVGGSLTGKGAHILLCDDTTKDRASAQSQTIRESTWGWFTSTAYTRLAPASGCIVMMTRWHCDDLVGRLLEHQNEEGAEQWEVVNYPAIAEEEEAHRHIGEALHPERFDVGALNRIRRAVGERDWNALYQQHPVPDGGAIFKSEWIKYWTPETLPDRFDRLVTSWDMTFKDTKNSDFVVGQVWGRKGGDYFLLDQVRGQMDYVATREAFKKMAEEYPKASRRLVEDKANGSAIISDLRHTVSGIVPVTPHESKEARAYAVTTLWEAGNVYLPPSALYPWVKRDLIPELLSFPSGAHDDQVDSMSMALSDMEAHKGMSIHPTNRSLLRQRLR